MRRWRSLSSGDKIAIIGVLVAVFAAVPTWLALRSSQGEPSNTTESPAPTSLATPTTAFDATDTTSGTTEASTAVAGMVTRYLTWNDRTDDSQEIPWFDGFVSDQGAQEIDGKPYARNLTFTEDCSSPLHQYADYNLGRHYEKFQATIGPGDTSTQTYHFEISRDGQRAFSGTLRHGQSRNIDLSVRNVLTLRVAACPLEPEPSAYKGGVYGDPRVIGKASEVPPPTTAG
jgi:hypothetical protein